MKRGIPIAVALLGCWAASAAELRTIPAGAYRPFFRGEKDAKSVEISAFRLGAAPVTNGNYLEFVRTNPQWQRSQVKRLFADGEYLQHWSGDLDLGAALAEQPVTFVSWFAAKAYCAWKGGRLPTTAEWEYAASAGFKSPDGASEPEFVRALARWYGTPSPAALPRVGETPANIFGVRDLHGLVWEWTSDFNSTFVTGDSRGDNSPDGQLFCGAGSLGAQDPTNYAAFMRFGFRSSLKAAYTIHNLGFRCASDSRPTPPPCCRELAAAKFSPQSLYQLDSTWLTDDKREVRLEALSGRPQVIALFFASCEFACPVIVHDMKRIEEALPPPLRKQVGFTLASFDAERDTPEILHAYRARVGLDPSNWTLLHDPADHSRELAASLGVSFQKDARGQFAHSNVITVVNKEGEVVHQLNGLNQDIAATVEAIKRALQQKSVAQSR